MKPIPNQLTFRQVCDDDVAIWHRAFALASQMSTAERRAAVFTALVLSCLRLGISMHDLLNREV